MNITLARNKAISNDSVTVGSLFGDDLVSFCDTIELPWRNNKRRVSCIPEGSYKVKRHKSPKFGDTFWVLDVPERSEILIHPANFTRQLLGCIAPGVDHSDIDGDGIIDVKSSRKAMKNLLSVLPDEFTLNVIWV